MTPGAEAVFGADIALQKDILSSVGTEVALETNMTLEVEAVFGADMTL